MELVAQRQVRDVDDDLGRDVARERLDRDREEQLLEDAAFLGARGLALDGERDLGRDRDVAADAHEVHVHELVAGRVALDLTGQGERVLLAVELQRDQRVGAGLAVERVVELTGGRP